MYKKQFLLVVLATLASQSLWAAQFARPNSTTDNAGWSAVGAPTHHEAVDESAASDSDYIDSTNGNESTIIMGLSGVTDPGGANLDDHIIRYRCQSSGNGGPERCNIALFQGNTEIGNNGNNSATRGSFTLITWTIPDASAISNYNDLNVRVTSTSLGGNESVQISWIELEVPDATASVPPTVTTSTFADVTETTATLGGNVTDGGSAPVTSRGVEWGTSPGTYTDSVPDGTGGTGIFTVPVTGLPSATSIYFRAWATNTAGTGVSAESNFTTLTPATPPTVTNTAATGIGQSSATLGGDVTADGGATVTERGIWWNTSSPAEAGTQVAMGSGTGPFSQLVSGLPAGTQIFHKAYATNSAGTSLSGELSFSTLAGLPTVDTPTVTNIGATSATLGGTVSSDGGGTVTERGIVWHTSSPPEAGGTVDPNGSGLGTFAETVGGLPTGTLVYFRAYAVNAAGTAYSAISSFTPADVPTVTSPTVANIGTNSADLGGNVTSNGGAALTARGTVWNTTGSPVVENGLAEGGTSTGIFSHTRSGLQSGTTVFYRAYATNSAGTSYSAESSFLTDTAADTQASNLAFSRTAGRSLLITWTRGSLDGVIVVFRLTSTGITHPADGDDYTGDPDFSAPPPELTGGPGNFVVYKGTGTSVLVTGLTMTTSYSVAVYEYAGVGAGTTYLAGPVEATTSTTDFAVHNYDYRADCNDCHNHGSFGARGTELKSICETCHNPSGLASAKLEFDNHTTPTRNPAIDDVDCGMCHELHNLSATNTTESLNSVTLLTQHNKSFLRANVDKYVTGAATPAYLHTDTPRRVDPHPDAPQAANNPDRAVEGGNDTTARGYCQNCHTLTNYHRSSNTAGAEQCHDGASDTSCGPAEVHCGACHEHSNNFTGAGGSCTGCHASVQGIRPVITTQFDRNSTHVPGGSAVIAPEDCEVCHDQSTHQAQTVRMIDADTGASYAQSTAAASTLATGEGEQFAPACLSCHDANGASRLPGTGDQTPTSPFTGSGAPPVIDATAWTNASHNRPVATSGSSPVTCVGGGANGCHGSGHGSEQNWLLAPAGGPTSSAIDFCYTCHDSDGPSTLDIQSEFAALDAAPNVVPVTSQSGATVDNRHELTQVACNECHSPHINNDANPVADPDTNLPLATYSSTGSYNEDGHTFAYNSGGNYDPLNPEGNPGGGFTEPDYIQFCLTCHDGTTPPGVSPTASMINIATAYNGTDQHGSGDGSTGNKTSKGGLKAPWVNGTNDAADNDPDQNYAAMNCNTCHGAHGTGSIFNLRESISVAGTVLTVGGVGGFLDEAAYAGNSTYTLPVIGANQADHYWGAWCTFCHKGDSHPGKVEADSCTGAHMHGGGSF